MVEPVDRLSRLSQADSGTRKGTIKDQGLLLIVSDLPTSHMQVEAEGITGQMMGAINDMLINLMATMARLNQKTRIYHPQNQHNIKDKASY